jgi:uncharacterized protein YeaO (DUF488 family)
MIQIKRIYNEWEKDDGWRVLVDRLWPRGVSKEKAKLNQWLKDIGPSNTLRQWFSHDPEKWSEFRKRYKDELLGKKDQLEQLKKLEREHGKVTLLYAARDKEHNEATILLDLLNE